MLGELNTLVTMVVTQVREGRITVGTLRASFIREGMESEELTLLMEIIALEVNLGGSPTFAMRRETKAYTASCAKQPRLVDVVG